MATLIRAGAIALGLICGLLGSYGAFEFAYHLEGAVTYLVIAAPVIAVAASAIPVIAEAAWRHGSYLKSALWWAILLPAAAVVFFSAAERVHVAKAGAEAERSAMRGAAERAQTTLSKAEAGLATATTDANHARGAKHCGPVCRTALATETTAQAAVEVARANLLKSERVATTESPLKAPVWLLPASLDLVAFAALWTGLAGFSPPMPKPETIKRKRPTTTKAKPRKARKAVALKGHANDNVIQFPAA